MNESKNGNTEMTNGAKTFQEYSVYMECTNDQTIFPYTIGCFKGIPMMI